MGRGERLIMKVTKKDCMIMLNGISSGVLDRVPNTKLSYSVVKNKAKLIQLMKTEEMKMFTIDLNYQIYEQKKAATTQQLAQNPKDAEVWNKKLEELEATYEKDIIKEEERQSTVEKMLDDEIEVDLHEFTDKLPENLTPMQVEIIQHFVKE